MTPRSGIEVALGKGGKKMASDNETQTQEDVDDLTIGKTLLGSSEESSSEDEGSIR